MSQRVSEPLAAGAAAAKGRAPLRVFVARRARALLWLCALASLSAPVSRYWPTQSGFGLQWSLELAAHWQWLYLGMGGVGLIVLLVARRLSAWLALPSLALVSAFFWQSEALEKTSAPAASGDVLAVASANLNLHTTDFDALLHWLRSPAAPDVIFLQEFTAQAQRALHQHPDLQQRYLYRLEMPQPDPFGLAILSRHPLTDMQALPGSDADDTLRLRALLDWRGRKVQVSAVHPMPPLSAALAQRRDEVLREEAQHLTQAGGLALLACDLNTTPWAPGLFAVAPQLRRASGVAGSWPQMGGWLSVLPLDHVLASNGWRLESRAQGPNLGSDHRPVVVRLVAAAGR